MLPLSLEEIKRRTDKHLPFSYKGIGGRTIGLTHAREHLHWVSLHKQIASYFSPLLSNCLPLPCQNFHVLDKKNNLALCFLPNSLPPAISFLKFPKALHEHHLKFFESEGPFSAGRRFGSHSPHASHHGVAGVMNGILLPHKHTHLPTLKFLAPLARAIQQAIKDFSQDLWDWIKDLLPPDFPSIGGSIFQSIAINYRAACVLHRDVSDHLPSWIYYFDSFQNGELSVPELGINIPVRPTSLLGIHGKYFFHGVLPYTGTRSSISFYSHYSKFSFPKFSKCSPEIVELISQLNWRI